MKISELKKKLKDIPNDWELCLKTNQSDRLDKKLVAMAKPNRKAAKDEIVIHQFRRDQW